MLREGGALVLREEKGNGTDERRQGPMGGPGRKDEWRARSIMRGGQG